MKKDLSVVIVNYNSGKLLKECLRSIKKEISGVNYEVIVVDNGSSDGSTQRIPEQFPDIKLIENHENLGFGQAANIGFKEASGRYTVLMNPDVVFTSKSMAKLIDYLDENEEVGIVGPKVYDDVNKNSLQLSARKFPSFLNYIFSRHSPLTKLFPNNKYSQEFLMSDWNHDEIRRVDWVSGCCMVFRSEMLEELEGMDEDYHLFFEDVDICYRANQKDWKVIYYPDLEVIHYGGKVREQKPFKTIVDRHISLWTFYRKFYQRDVILSAGVWAGTYLRMIFLILLTGFKKLSPVLLDSTLLILSAAASFALRTTWNFPWTGRAINSFTQLAPWYFPFQIFLCYAFNLYNSLDRIYQDYLVIIPQTIKAATVGSVSLVFVAFFARIFYLPRSIVFSLWIFNIVLLSSWRLGLLFFSRRSEPTKRVLIYGTGDLAHIIEEEIRRRSSLKYDPVGFIRTPRNPKKGNEKEVLGSLQQLATKVNELDINEVIYAPEDRSSDDLLEVMDHCGTANLNTRIAPKLFEIATGTIHLEHFDIPFIDPYMIPARNWYFKTKRVIDLVIATIMLALTAPLMAVIALMVKFSSSGPIFFRQSRIGKNGEQFTLFKFRTMYCKPNEPLPDGIRERSDLEKMTPVGRLLRLTRMDELPQLLNVLKGDMSLVGPRAERVEIAKKMAEKIPFFNQRYLIRPGMTGWAQVEFKYTTSVEEYRKKLQYDLFYIKNISFSLDIEILFKTIYVVITGKGAR